MPEAGGPRRAWTRTVHAPAAWTASASWLEREVRSDMPVLYGQIQLPPSSQQVGGTPITSGSRGQDRLIQWRRAGRGERGRLMYGAADRLIEEALRDHLGRVVQIAPVDHERIGHRLAHAVQVQAAELAPRREQDERVGALCNRVGIRAQLH